MIYTHKNSMLSIAGGRGYFYDNDNLVFVGDAYKAILMFIKSSKNNENVLNQFKKQLETREVCKLRNKKKDESL